MAVTITVPRGDSLTWDFDIAADITGWTPKWMAKPLPGYPDVADGAATLTATVGAGLTVTNAVTGLVSLSIAAATMAAVVPGTYAWDLQLTNGPTIRTVKLDGSWTGTLVVEPDVARS